MNRLLQVGVDHRTVALDLLAALHRDRARSGGSACLAAGAGVVELATCHRLELYLEGVQEADGPEMFLRVMGAGPGTADLVRGKLVSRTGLEAGRHLLRVTAGLESAVLGEDQILAQARAAYREACDRRSAGPLLHRLFHAAFRVGKRCRAETSLGSGGRSLAGAAVAVLNRSLHGLRSRTVLVLGVGEMGELAARRLQRRGVRRLLLCNRSWWRCVQLARELDAEALPWQWRGAVLSRVDGVICATGASSPVLRADWLFSAGLERALPLTVIDLGVPPNVQPLPIPISGVTLLDVEQLTRRLSHEAGVRASAATEAARIVEHELSQWADWSRTRDAVAGACRGRRGRNAS
jgi:glutamyl-tRNA reductase